MRISLLPAASDPASMRNGPPCHQERATQLTRYDREIERSTAVLPAHDTLAPHRNGADNARTTSILAKRGIHAQPVRAAVATAVILANPAIALLANAADEMAGVGLEAAA
jgi:hypothetical protein